MCVRVALDTNVVTRSCCPQEDPEDLPKRFEDLPTSILISNLKSVSTFLLNAAFDALGLVVAGFVYPSSWPIVKPFLFPTPMPFVRNLQLAS